MPWDEAGLGPLDFAEQLLAFTEDEPETAAADIERLKQERIEMQKLQDQDDSSGAGPSTSPHTSASGTKRRSTEGGDEKDPKVAKAEGGGVADIALNKACREKARRCRLNDRFAELATLLEEPGQGGPKTDKATILISAISAVTNLRREIGQLRQLNKYLEERVAQFEKESSRQMYQQVLAFNGLQGQPGAQSDTPQAPAQQAQLQHKAMFMPNQSAAMASQQQQVLQQQQHPALMQQLPGMADPMYQASSDPGPSSSAAAPGAPGMASMAQMQAFQQTLQMTGGATVAAQGKHPLMPYGPMTIPMTMPMPVQMQPLHHNNSFLPTAMNPAQDAQLRPPVA